MPRNNFLRAAATGAVALVACLLTTQPAHADIQIFADAAGHIDAVRVSHGPSTVGVTAYDKRMTIRTRYRFWLDTDPSDPGPEYKALVYPDSDAVPLMRVANFSSGGIKFDCDGFRGIADTDGGEYAKIIVPRVCIGTPSRVRVSVVGYYDEDSDPAVDVVDWAPGEQRFFPWVNRRRSSGDDRVVKP
jgi:hypothetical protein